MDLIEATARSLDDALEAARQKDVRAYVISMAESRAAETLAVQLQRLWPSVEFGQIETIVAKAVDALFVAVADKKTTVSSPLNYLFGAARNLLRRDYSAGFMGVVEFDPNIHDQPERSATNELSDISIAAKAKALGLDDARFKACTSGPGRERVQRDAKEAEGFQVASTPTFFVGLKRSNGTTKIVERLSGAKPHAAFKVSLDKWLATAGVPQ